MIHIQNQNSCIEANGLIFNWNTTNHWDKNNECVVNFEIPYSVSCPVQIKIEHEDKFMVFDITHSNFKIKRKDKRFKQAKWFAIGY